MEALASSRAQAGSLSRSSGFHQVDHCSLYSRLDKNLISGTRSIMCYLELLSFGSVSQN